MEGSSKGVGARQSLGSSKNLVVTVKEFAHAYFNKPDQ